MGIVKPMNIEDRQTVPLKAWRKGRWPKKRPMLIGGLLLLFLSGSISTVAGFQAYHTYHTDLLLAQTEMQHLHTAMALLKSFQTQPFTAQTIEHAQQEFAGALGDGQAIEADLASYAGMAGLVPIYGPRLQAAIHLSALAVDVSQAGISGCKILEMVLTLLGSPLNAATPGLTSADFTALSQQYQMVKSSLNATMNEALLVKPSDVSFDSHLATLLQEFQANIPTIRTALTEADQLLPVLPTLLGIATPSHYLLEILDSTELRPGGGFIGNYGIATLSGGRLTSAHITDVVLLDGPFSLAGHTIPYPAAYSWFGHYLAPGSWSLRDSNLDADFPTDARNGEVNFEREGGNVPLQGVIAITPFFIENMLNITGPISVPEYHETVTSQNLVSLIHFYQLGGAKAGEGSSLVASSGGHSSQRKRFTELLSEHLLARMQQLPSGTVAKFLQLAASSLHTKDIQLYFNPSDAENVLHLLHLDGTIQSPPGDHFFLVDTNVAANKANNFIVNSVHDQITIDELGNAVHRTTITSAWTLRGENYGSNLYRDYVRLYVPSGSTLSQQSGWQSLGTSTGFGSQVWTGYYTLVYGQTRTITLLWTSYGVAKKDANGWHYQYVLQRQAGTQRTLDLQVMLPSCAIVTNTWGGLLSKNTPEETFNQPFTQDLNVGVDYSCR